MARTLTATQVFLRALKETGEYNHVMKVVRDKNKRSDHIGLLTVYQKSIKNYKII